MVLTKSEDSNLFLHYKTSQFDLPCRLADCHDVGSSLAGRSQTLVAFCRCRLRKFSDSLQHPLRKYTSDNFLSTAYRPNRQCADGKKDDSQPKSGLDAKKANSFQFFRLLSSLCSMAHLESFPDVIGPELAAASISFVKKLKASHPSLKAVFTGIGIDPSFAHFF